MEEGCRTVAGEAKVRKQYFMVHIFHKKYFKLSYRAMCHPLGTILTNFHRPAQTSLPPAMGKGWNRALLDSKKSHSRWKCGSRNSEFHGVGVKGIERCFEDFEHVIYFLYFHFIGIVVSLLG